MKFCLLCINYQSVLVTHWEKYNTGVMNLPPGYHAQLLTICTLYLLYAMAGPALLQVELPGSLSLTNCLVLVLVFSTVFSCVRVIISAVWNIRQADKEGRGEQWELCEKVRPLVSGLIATVYLIIVGDLEYTFLFRFFSHIGFFSPLATFCPKTRAASLSWSGLS